MAQLFFRYGAMNSGKSIDILKVKHNYEEQGKNVLLLTSALDNRDGEGKVSSRIGISQPAHPVGSEDNIIELIYQLEGHSYISYNCILVDEAQFLTEEHVLQLANIVDKMRIPVMCYGLKNDFQNNLFEGTRALLIHADKIEEIKTLCWQCNRKAIMNLRMNNGRPVRDGEQVQIGGNESYIPVCRNHYNNPITRYDFEEIDKSIEDLFNEEVNN